MASSEAFFSNFLAFSSSFFFADIALKNSLSLSALDPFPVSLERSTDGGAAEAAGAFGGPPGGGGADEEGALGGPPGGGGLPADEEGALGGPPGGGGLPAFGGPDTLGGPPGGGGADEEGALGGPPGGGGLPADEEGALGGPPPGGGGLPAFDGPGIFFLVVI